jgi:hypothetical protein
VDSKFSFANVARWLRSTQPAADFIVLPETGVTYRDHHLELKSLMVGWQVTITKDGSVLTHTSITDTREAASAEAQGYVDTSLLQAKTLEAKSHL